MDSHWYKYKSKKETIRKRQTLYSMCVGFAFFVILFILTKIFSISLCPIKSIFGISCFGCGMTRGFISILEFKFKSAYDYNVLSIPIFLSIGVYFVFFLVDMIFDKNFISIIEKQLAKKYMFFIYVPLLILATILNNIN